MALDRTVRSRSVVVIGGSAGSFEANRAICSVLRHDLPAAAFVVQHMPADPRTDLDRLLQAGASVNVRTAEDRAPITTGEVRTACPDRHLVLDEECVRLTRGPRENHTRPAIDPLFRSAAVHHQGRVIAVLLSGYLSDGVAGLEAVRRCGGLTIVQDPDDAGVEDLPLNALDHHKPDFIAGKERIGELINQLAGQPAPEDGDVPEDIRLEARMAVGQALSVSAEENLGRQVPFSCPDCDGYLWQIDDCILRFRCRVGHAFTADALAEAQSAKLDAALWSALRELRERAELLRRLADQLQNARDPDQRFLRAAAEAEEHAGVLMQFLLERPET